MDIKGKVIQILPLQTGEGKNGPWKKQEFIIEVPGRFPKKVCFSMWGDNITQFPVNMGEDITVFFDLESREYNSRWYTEAKAWKVEKGEAQTFKTPDQAPDFSSDPREDSQSAGKNLTDTSYDDLPF
jgi:hypothetical protein